MIQYNEYNKGKGKMKNGRRINKKSKKINREIYNSKFVRKIISSSPKKK
tara:strand:+ start:1021 stop:1167 length:147 start_codon:yes stop_codon:yes gene_type:complete